MATLTQPSHGQRRGARMDDRAGRDPSQISQVLVAFAIAVAIILVVLFAIGAR